MSTFIGVVGQMALFVFVSLVAVVAGWFVVTFVHEVWNSASFIMGRNGRVVTSPLAKTAVILVLIVCTPVMLLLHKPLRWLGRKGIISEDEDADGRHSLTLSAEAFRKRTT